MSGHGVDISVVVTVHHEGRLAHRTMRSVSRSAEYARQKGMSVEVIVVMDSPDQATKEYFGGYGSSDVVVKDVAFGDPGLARNHGVMTASGEYVAFVDGDNLIAGDWLYRAVEYLRRQDCDLVAHPEYHIVFEGEAFIWLQVSSSSAECYVDDLLEFNHWDTVGVAKKEIYAKYPFESTAVDSGFGFEDWHFNCQTLADGIEHHVVPNTAHFRRIRGAGSRTDLDNGLHRVIRPTKLFNPHDGLAVLERYMGRQARWAGAVSGRNDGSTRSKDIRRELFRFIQAVGRRVRAKSPQVFGVVLWWWRRVSALGKASMATINGARWLPTSLPDWLITEWREIHAIEPELFPEAWLTQTIQVKHVFHSGIGKPYIEMCRLYGKNVSHVFLVPWLKMGGADLEALNYIEALVKYGFGKEIVVIATCNTESPWARRLPGRIRFIEFGKLYPHLAAREQETLLTRVLIQMAPQAVHNLNSDLGYRIFVKYGKALKSVSNLYANTFCKEVTSEGQTVGYAFLYLPGCFDHLTAIASDNQAFLDDLRTLYAFDKEKLYVHYQPIQNTEKRVRRASGGEKERLDVLWAGRMDRQKRPDILAKIAAACADLPYVFHVYGAPLLEADRSCKTLKRQKNVICHGGYDGFVSLLSERYDLFLYTSQWDGLPNVLLEAIASGLPVVASDVGGIRELIVNGKTGFLIDPYDDVDAYVACLQRICSDRSQLESAIGNAQELVRSRHSWERFRDDLGKFPGYVLQR